MCPICRSENYATHRVGPGVRYVGQCLDCGHTAYELVSLRSVLDLRREWPAARKPLERIADGMATQILETGSV